MLKGWKKIGSNGKWHYFDGATDSLCNLYQAPDLNPHTLIAKPPASADLCKFCQNRLYEKENIKFITLACDVCGTNFKYQYNSAMVSTKLALFQARQAAAAKNWHYVTADKARDGRCWELCPSEICKDCKKKDKKAVRCEHSCRMQWERVRPPD